MNSVIKKIEKVLRQKYPEGTAAGLLAQASCQEMSVQTFQEQLGLTLPVAFCEFYEWAMHTYFPKKEASTKIELSHFDEEYIPSLSKLLSSTQNWRAIQAMYPLREWKSGFVVIGSWNSCNVKVIDTKGEVGSPGCVLYWDFKGGDSYYIIHQSFEKHLETMYARLENDCYFPPANDDEIEDFHVGTIGEKIDKIKQAVNKGYPQYIRDWLLVIGLLIVLH